MSIPVEQARQACSPFTRAEVAALQASFYHLHLFQGDHGQLLMTAKGEPLALKSLAAVRHLLAQLPVATAERVHRSPFGEMIGQAAGDNTLRIPLTLHTDIQGETK